MGSLAFQYNRFFILNICYHPGKENTRAIWQYLCLTVHFPEFLLSLEADSLFSVYIHPAPQLSYLA